MAQTIRLQSAAAFSSAFRVPPEVVEETVPPLPGVDGQLGLYGWKTPRLDGFEVPETDELIIALHLGGSRQVRAVTDAGYSRGRSMPGLVTVLPPGRSAAFRTGGSVSLVSLHVPAPLAAGLSLPADWQPRFAFRDPYVSSSLEALLRAARAGATVRPDYVIKVVDAMLCHLAQWRQDAAPTPAGALPDSADVRWLGRLTLAELYARIDARLGSPLPLDELAAATGLSRAAFTRGFRQATGTSVHQAITERRLGVARAQLADPRLTISQIAQDTGWSSQSHFTAAFRAATGCTPARYRAGQR